MTVHDRRWPLWVAVAWVIAVSWFGIDAQKPPPSLPADAPSEQFAAGRAQKHVEAIARAPHPMGSPEAERVRRVLVQKLEELGLVPEIQSPKISDSPARNVLTRLKGQDPPGKKALMLCAHYDSVPAGPGASDDASGVAVVLETLRALKAGPPLDRDVIVLFMEWVLPLALAAAVLFLVLVVISVRTGRLRLVDLVAGAGIFFVAVWASLAAVWILWYVLRGLFDGAGFPWQKFDVAILTGFAALTTAVTLLLVLVVLFLGTMLPLLGPLVAPGPKSVVRPAPAQPAERATLQ